MAEHQRPILAKYTAVRPYSECWSNGAMGCLAPNASGDSSGTAAFIQTPRHNQVGQLHRNRLNDGHGPAARHDARQLKARVTEQRLPLHWRALAPEQHHLQQCV